MGFVQSYFSRLTWRKWERAHALQVGMGQSTCPTVLTNKTLMDGLV